MITSNDHRRFKEELLDGDVLERALEWIRENIEPEDVYGKKPLIDWAEGAGYTRGE